MIKKRILFPLLFLLFIFLARGFIVGSVLEPYFEKTLSELFGMRVEIKELFLDPLHGKVRASRLTFHHRSEFAPAPHLDAKGIEFSIHLGALQNKSVEISNLILNQPFYFIDRIATPEGPRNNVVTWFRHIKSRRRPRAADEPEDPRKWKVAIDKISLRDTTFIIHDRSPKEGEKKFVFRKMDATLLGFEWPAEDPEILSQRVTVKGLFGEHYPAPFWITGDANFATSQINFDLKGAIKEGNLLEHKRLWEGLPIEIKKGRFQLKMHVICEKRQLKSINHLRLQTLEAKSGPAAADKIWGLPTLGFIGILQDKKTISLKVPVKGNISDPEFGFHKAFREAFQVSLKKHTTAGIKKVTEGTAKIATQTGELVRETPTKLAESFEKVTGLVSSILPPAAESGASKDQKAVRS